MQSFVPMPKALQHSSYIPAKPAEIIAERDLSSPSFEGAPFDVQIGDGPIQTFVPGAGETHATFFARIASANVVDENGQNPLTISLEPFRVVFRSKARVRLSGIFAGPFFFGDQDASPIEPKVYDTDTAHVRHGELSLGEHLATIDARYLDPRTMIVGQRLHPAFATLVSLGATIGDTIEIYHGAGYDVFTIDGSVSAFDFVAFIQNSQAFNTSFGSHLDAYVDFNFQNVVVFSKTRQTISLQATRTATFAAIFGALPQ